MGRTILWLSDVNQILKVQEDINFALMLHEISCLRIVAHVRDSHEITHTMHFMNGMNMMSDMMQQQNGMRKISSKHLVIYSEDMNITDLEGITINYNVEIYQGSTGAKSYYLLT